MLIPVAVAFGLVAFSAGQTQPAARLTPAEQEQFLRTAKVVAQRHLGKGITESSRTTLESNGFRHDAHFQHIDITKKEFASQRRAELNFRDSYKFNIAAYELAKLLGIDDMIPPSIERRVDGNTGALTWWVDNVMMDETKRTAKKLQPPDPQRWNREMQVVRVFDQLIYNTDRNLGNLLITEDWNIWIIDHTRAFRMSRTLLRPENLTHCDRSLLARMRELNGAVLKERLGRWLTRLEIEGLLARRDAIVKVFDEAVKREGEDAALFDRPKRN